RANAGNGPTNSRKAAVATSGRRFRARRLRRATSRCANPYRRPDAGHAARSRRWAAGRVQPPDVATQQFPPTSEFPKATDVVREPASLFIRFPALALRPVRWWGQSGRRFFTEFALVHERREYVHNCPGSDERSFVAHVVLRCDFHHFHSTQAFPGD